MSIPTNLLETLKMNSCFMMLAYHSAFGLKDERLENYTPLDHVKNQAFENWNEGTKQDVTMPSKLGIHMLHRTLDLFIIHIWNMWPND
jgi:hypothetical protein